MRTMPPEALTRIRIPREALRDFCARWRIAEFSLFGSVLRDDFSDASDVDVLVTFDDQASWSVFDHFQMERELSALLGRRAEIVSRRALEEGGNWIIRRSILESAQRVDVA
jgi:uncharacterized protein